MTYLAKPQAAPPHPAGQQARLHPARLRGQDLDPVRRLRPRLDLGGAGAGLLGARHRAAPGRQAVGHRLLVEDARLLPRRLARLQHRARAHALGADRRQPGQPRAALPRRQRRRRLGLDRPRPVRPRHAPRREHDLHRREQRRLRPDQGPVLGHRRPGQQEQEGRGQQRHRDRPGGDGAAARRELRRPQLLRRQGAARAADQGRAQPPRRRLARRHQPVRRLQQPSRQHQELRLRAGAQRGGEPARLHAPARCDHGDLRARAR